MHMCEDCNYIYDGDIYVKCPQCGSSDVEETKPTIIIGLGNARSDIIALINKLNCIIDRDFAGMYYDQEEIKKLVKNVSKHFSFPKK